MALLADASWHSHFSAEFLDEFYALQAIYSEDAFGKVQETREGLRFRLTLADGHSGGHGTFSLDILVPQGYPDRQRPRVVLVSLDGRKPTEAMVKRVEEGLQAEGAALEGQVCIWVLVEAIRSIVNDWHQEQGTDANDDDNEERKSPESPIRELRVSTSAPIEDRKSSFMGYAVSFELPSHLDRILDQLRKGEKFIHRASHVIWAYRVRSMTPPFRVLADHDDDGETGAGARLSDLLRRLLEEREDNGGGGGVLVVVARHFGGVHLGHDRFKHINAVARLALEAGGYLRPESARK